MSDLDIKDQYYTIAAPAEGRLTIQRSRFLGYSYPISSTEEAENIVKNLRQKDFYDATHVCYAYALGLDRGSSRMDDNGEPNGTAGRPIYAQLLKKNLSDVLLVVVRYFGGVKLGTSGLIKAYGECASLALEAAKIKEILLYDMLEIHFEPNLTGIVMNILNKQQGSILSQDYSQDKIVVQYKIRQSQTNMIVKKMAQIFGVLIKKVLPLQA